MSDLAPPATPPWRRRLHSAVDRTVRVWRHRWFRNIRIAAAVGLVGITSAVIGVMLFAHTEINVGPFKAEMSLRPSVVGGTEVDIPPLGSLHLDSHRGTLHLKVALGSLDQSRTEELIDNPTAISSAGDRAVDEVTTGVTQLALRTVGLAVLSAIIAAGLIFRSVRRTAAA